MTKRGALRVLVLCALVCASVPSPTLVSAARDNKEFVGQLVQLASDDGDFEASGEPTWFVRSGESLIPVHAGDVDAESGDIIRFAESPGSSVSESEIASARIVDSTVSAAGVVPDRMLTVVPVTFAGSSWTAQNQALADQVATNLKSWWRSTSSKKETLSVRFTQTLDLQQKVTGCDYSKIRSEVMAYVTSLKLSGPSHHVMATFVGDSIPCGWSGLGEMPGIFTWTFTRSLSAMKTWAHELGHNLGLPHANSCQGSVTLTYLRKCEDVEYGNTVATMGFGGADATFTPVELRQLEWLNDGNILSWNGTTQTVTLQRFDRIESGYTAVRIPSASAELGDVDVWLQYSTEARTYYPNGLPVVVSNGVVVSFEPSKNFRSSLISRNGVSGSMASLSYLCDLTPGAGSATSADFRTDPRLLVGQTWTEPRGRFSVRVDAVTAEGATVTLTSLTPTLSTPTSVAGTADPGGLAAINFSWSPEALTAGLNEPVEWKVDMVEDPTKTCSGTAFRITCSVVGLTRGSTYTPRLVHLTGAVQSTPVVGAPIMVERVPPVLAPTFTATDSTVTISASIDDGGSPVTAPAMLRLEDGQTCALPADPNGSCTFVGLQRNRTYGVTADLANAIGTRSSPFDVKTVGATPDPLVISARFEGNDLVIKAASSERDKTNVEEIDSFCWSETRDFWPDLVLKEGESAKVFTIPDARGLWFRCRFVGYAPSAPKNPYGLDRVLVVTKSGAIRLPSISTKIVARSPRKGVVTLKWTAKDGNGRVTVNSVKTSKKSCAFRGRKTCTVTGLKRGSTFVAVIQVSGPSGYASARTTVVVK